MIYSLARTKKAELLVNEPLERLSQKDISWFWIDFVLPDDKEVSLLREHFRFDNLAIEDCIGHLERPKVDYFDNYNFFVFHALNENTLEPVEVDLFVGENFVVSFCKTKLQEIDNARHKVLNSTNNEKEGATFIVYLILNMIVDSYFPTVYRIEDSLNEIDIRSGDWGIHNLIDQVFEIRNSLLKLRHIINSMKELLYRMLSSEHLENFKDKKRHFSDIYDHLLKLSDIIESNREVTADVRDNYLSINSHKMNKIMTVMTVVTSIFIPLTFIVGIYGMNFDNIPELKWRYGYFYVLGIMAFIGISMFLWFKRKGWFDFKK